MSRKTRTHAVSRPVDTKQQLGRQSAAITLRGTSQLIFRNVPFNRP